MWSAFFIVLTIWSGDMGFWNTPLKPILSNSMFCGGGADAAQEIHGKFLVLFPDLMGHLRTASTCSIIISQRTRSGLTLSIASSPSFASPAVYASKPLAVRIAFIESVISASSSITNIFFLAAIWILLYVNLTYLYQIFS